MHPMYDQFAECRVAVLFGSSKTGWGLRFVFVAFLIPSSYVLWDQRGHFLCCIPQV